MPRPPSAPDTTSASTRTEPYPPWDPLFAYNNLPPVPGEQLTAGAVERRCQLATAALETLRNATTRFADPYALFQTAALIKAQASSAIRGIVTAVGEMIEHMDRPRLTNSTAPDTSDALRHYDRIIDAWQHRGCESVGTPMPVRARSTTKGRRVPVRRGHGTVIAGPRGNHLHADRRCGRSASTSPAVPHYMND